MGQLDLMDALRSDTEQIYRPFENNNLELLKEYVKYQVVLILGISLV